MEDNDLPPGFRFYPTEEELISFYLRNKLQGTKEHDLNRVIPVIDLYELHPSDLPQFAGELCRGDPEQWFFFSPRQEREARGGRPSRTTASGYWKATGSPSYVRSSSNQILGMKKTMVFYSGRAPHGRKTEWKMNEYKAIKQVSSSINTIPQLRDEFSLCRVYVKNGSLRSFDRRPTGATTGTTTDHHHAIKAIHDGHHQAEQGDHDHVDTAQRQHHDPPLMVAAEKINTSKSPESSSSLVGSAVRPPQDNQAGHSDDDDDDGDDNWQMEEDFKILLELEKLNWV